MIVAFHRLKHDHRNEKQILLTHCLSLSWSTRIKLIKNIFFSVSKAFDNSSKSTLVIYATIFVRHCQIYSLWGTSWKLNPINGDTDLLRNLQCGGYAFILTIDYEHIQNIQENWNKDWRWIDNPHVHTRSCLNESLRRSEVGREMKARQVP